MTNFIKNYSHSIIISVITVIFLSSVAVAQDSNKRNGGKGDQREGLRAMKQLDLSDDQKTQIKDIFSQRNETTTDSRSQRNEVRSLIEAGDINGAAEIAATQARIRVTNMADKREALNAILTAEQLEKLTALQAERQLKREQRSERRSSRRNSSEES